MVLTSFGAMSITWSNSCRILFHSRNYSHILVFNSPAIPLLVTHNCRLVDILCLYFFSSQGHLTLQADFVIPGRPTFAFAPRDMQSASIASSSRSSFFAYVPYPFSLSRASYCPPTANAPLPVSSAAQPPTYNSARGASRGDCRGVCARRFPPSCFTRLLLMLSFLCTLYPPKGCVMILDI